MTKNVGSTDRTVRIIIGIIVAIVGVIGLLGYIPIPLWLNIVLIVVGIVLVITAMIRFCGLYTLIGINTCDCKDCSCGQSSDDNSNNVTQ
jgi:hypothetical protein